MSLRLSRRERERLEALELAEERGRTAAARKRFAEGAATVIRIWSARLDRGEELFFQPTIGGAIAAGRPWLSFYCPACGVTGSVDLRTLDRHPQATVESLIPSLSCRRCSPHPPFAKLTGLRKPHPMEHRPYG